MKPNQQESEYAVCPYYRKESNERKQIFCDSFYDGSLLVNITLSDDYDFHRQHFCYSLNNWHRCPIAKMLNEQNS